MTAYDRAFIRVFSRSCVYACRAMAGGNKAEAVAQVAHAAGAADMYTCFAYYDPDVARRAYRMLSALQSLIYT